MGVGECMNDVGGKRRYLTMLTITCFQKKNVFKIKNAALAGVAQLVGMPSCNRTVASSNPNQGTCQGCRLGSGLGPKQEAAD